MEQLLQLSRLDSGARIARQAVDFGALVRGVAAEQAGAALRKGQQLALELPQDASDLQVQGDPTLLALLVRNLLDNAIRYSPGGATVRLQLQREAAQVLLAVEDSGPGVDAAALQRLGERFFRVLGNGGEGSGLGWSIVRRIAAAHDATVEGGAQPQPGRPAGAGADSGTARRCNGRLGAVGLSGLQLIQRRPHHRCPSAA